MILSFFRIGRKPTMYVSTLFLLAIALSIAWAPSIEVYMIQSACLGFFVVGMFMPIYVTGMLSWLQLGRVAQSVTCLATDACLTADQGVASSYPVRSHTFVEMDNEIISTAILLPSADLFKKGCCQLQAKVCARITC